VIGKAGGVVESPDGTKVDIPKGALFDEVTVSINRISSKSELWSTPKDEKIKLLDYGYVFLPDKLVFYKPIKLRLAYNIKDWDTNKNGVLDRGEELNPDEFVIFFLDGNEWIRCGVTENEKTDWGGYITTKVNHFCIFAIGVDKRDLPKEADFYPQKNPFKAEEGTTFQLELPQSAEVTLRIFDLAGDLLREIVYKERYSAGVNSIRWDGKNNQGEYLTSGIYIYYAVIILENKRIYRFKEPIGVIR
jgi:hypothetical protein